LTLRITRRAKGHLLSINLYIRERNPRAARRVADTLRVSFEMLRRHPFAGRLGAVSGTREFSVVRFPYVVVYEVSTDQTVTILGVFHTAQDQRKI